MASIPTRTVQEALTVFARRERRTPPAIDGRYGSQTSAELIRWARSRGEVRQLDLPPPDGTAREITLPDAMAAALRELAAQFTPSSTSTRTTSTRTRPSDLDELGTQCAHHPADGAIGSRYGTRTSRQEPGESRMHNGLDIGGGRGAPVYAVGDGIVEHATENGARGFSRYGRVIVIRHPQWLGPSGQAIRSLYAHLDDQTVREGDRVHAGQTIGHIGSSNGSVEDPGSTFERSGTSGPHLHFELADRAYPMAHEDRRLEPVAELANRGVHYRSDGRPDRSVPSCTPEESAESRRLAGAGSSSSRGGAGIGLALAGLGLGFVLLSRKGKGR